VRDVQGMYAEQVQGELRQLSRQSAPDIDGWITQAKQLQVDIERSKATAREIVQGAEAGKTLDAHVKDASSKVDLLRKELDFNVTLAGTLEQLQIISGLLDGAQNAASEGELSDSLEKLGNARKVIDQLDSFENTRFAGLVQRRATQLRDILVGRVQEYWHGMVKFTPAERNVTIHGELKGEVRSL
jgi:centromere/kinetochore protein ZW10